MKLRHARYFGDYWLGLTLGSLSLDGQIAQADFEGCSPYTGKDPQAGEVQKIINAILADTKNTDTD